MQNKLIVLLLLSKTVTAQDAKPAAAVAPPKANPSAPGSDVPPLSKDIKKAIIPANVADLPVAPAKLEAPRTIKAYSAPLKAVESTKRRVEDDKKSIKMSVSARGGAAATLLPETVKEDNKEETSSNPLLSENDARCYAARYSDLKGTSALTHFATIGVP